MKRYPATTKINASLTKKADKGNRALATCRFVTLLAAVVLVTMPFMETSSSYLKDVESIMNIQLNGESENRLSTPKITTEMQKEERKQVERKVVKETAIDAKPVQATIQNDPKAAANIAAVSQHDGSRMLTIKPETLRHLKTLGEIPKLIHVMWPDKNVIDTDFAVITHGIKRMQMQNHGWEVLVHDDNDIREMIKNFQPPPSGGKEGKEWFPESMRTDLLNGHIIEQTDAFRVMVMYEQGGFYTDIDKIYNIPIEEVVDINTTKLVVPTYLDVNFAQAFFASAPKNDLIMNILRRQSEKRAGMLRKQGWLKSSNVMDLCKTHSSSLEEDMFGFDLYGKEAEKFRNSRPKAEWWNETRHIINEHSEGLILTKKDDWCDGLLLRDYPGCKRVGREGLYEHYNITRWKDAVNAVWGESD